MNPIINLYIYPAYILIAVFLFLRFFYRIIYAPYKIRTSNISISEILAILNSVINAEIDMYEKNIFTKRGALTNANYENYYRDLVDNICNSLSEEFFFKSRIFLKEEAIVKIICRAVKQYLNEKIYELNNIE